jgi:anti-sigma regulatory factor (Ser/Thr protein kinase)
MEDLSLHILDIAENATSAGATLVEIGIRLDSSRDELVITIRDNGRGMEAGMLTRVRDPFVTTRKTRRVGLGIPLMEQACRDTGGHLDIESKPGEGTYLKAVLKAGHIDCKPLADIGSTMITLISGNPEVDFVFESDLDGKKIEIDTREIKAELEDVSICDPEVLALIRGMFEDRD